MSFPMMASYAALFGLWSMTQFVLVSAWHVVSLYNYPSDRFAVGFAPSDCAASAPEPSALIKDAP